MKKSQLALIALAAVVIAVIAFLGSGAGSGGDDAATKDADAPGRPPADAVTVAFVYSPEKEPLLKPLLEQFNKAKESVNGRQIVVDASIVASGDAQSMIAGERLKPTVWSPASSLWGRLLNFQADRPLAPDESPSIVRTPLVIAMWEPMAKALGYPKKSLGFGDILKLARSKQGWREYGHREWGDFKLVHTNPDVSTSGLSAVVAEYFAATGKKEGLRESDINGKARRTVRAIERSIVHYGDTTLFISEQLKKSGPGYASAVAMEEATLVAFNRDRGNQPKLVGIYPSEGTFYSDNPFIVLDAPWVTDEQRAAAEVLQRWLGERLTPEVVSRAGFRPADLDTPPVAPIDAANGADPEQPKRVLSPPEPRVLAAIKNAWREDRKPANVLLVFDTSGSMNEENRLPRAKEGLNAFLAQVASQDRVGLMAFSDRIEPLVPIGPFGFQGQFLQQMAENLIADGGTAVYDAVNVAVNEVATIANDDWINAVVLLSDGEDTDSSTTLEQLTRSLEAFGDSSSRVRVFTIAYSAGAVGAKEALQKIAEASGGKAYDASTDDIETVYRSISSFF